MVSFLSSKKAGLIIVLLLTAAIPLTVIVSQRQQETRQRAETAPPGGDCIKYGCNGPNLTVTWPNNALDPHYKGQLTKHGDVNTPACGGLTNCNDHFTELTNQETYTFTGLSPNTTYDLYVWTIDNNGLWSSQVVGPTGACTGGYCSPPSSPTPTCRPRPACLDQTPRCLIAETTDMCPPSKPIPPRSFLQGSGWVSAVDTAAKTVTISYPQPATACSPTFCPKGRPPDILKTGTVLVINSQDGVENDITKMKVGDGVTVYLLQYSGNNSFQSNNYATPYAAKDFSLLPANCDPLTKICSGSVTITPEKIPTPIPTSVPRWGW